MDRPNDLDSQPKLALVASIQADLDRLRALVQPQLPDGDPAGAASLARPLAPPLVRALTEMPAIDEEMVIPSV